MRAIRFMTQMSGIKWFMRQDYEKVKDFLLEDEYVQIRGRYQENTESQKSEPVFA